MDVAEDLTQEVMFKIFKELSSFLHPPYNLKNWASKIAQNTGISYWRAKRRRQYGDIKYTNENDKRTKTPEDKILAKDRETLLKKAIENETDLEACETADMYYQKEMPVREIAKSQGISESAVKSRLYHFRGRLRKYLTRFALEN